MRGRKPTPTRMRILRGNPGRRPLNAREPSPVVVVPEPPTHLAAEALEEWQRIAPLLVEEGLLTNLDRAGLAAYCVAYGRWVEAEEHVRKLGVLVKSPGGFPIHSPYLSIANRAMEQMHRLLAEFGMSPSSRSRVTGKRQEEKDPFEDFGGLRVVDGKR